VDTAATAANAVPGGLGPPLVATPTDLAAYALTAATLLLPLADQRVRPPEALPHQRLMVCSFCVRLQEHAAARGLLEPDPAEAEALRASRRNADSRPRLQSPL